MSEADDLAREFERRARRALDDSTRRANDGGPPTMPTEAVRPSMRPDPALPDPLNGRSGQPSREVPSVDQGRSAVPRPQSPSQRRQHQQQVVQPQPQPRPQPPPQRQPPPSARTQPQQVPRPQPQPPQRPPGHRQPQPNRPQPRSVPQQRLQQAATGPTVDERRAVADQWTRSTGPQQKQKPRSKGRRKRDAKEVHGNRAREATWASNRWAVPYFTDGPKVTLGVLWFAFLMGGALLGFNYDNSAVSSVAVAVVTSTVAALAGLQIGFAWFPKNPATRNWTAAAAFAAGIAGFYGPWGVVIGLVIGLLVLTAYLMLYRGHRRTPAQLFDVLVRAAVPVGLASASLGAMAYRNLPVLIALILFVSAYEVGDFLIGSGAFNPVEGPMAGIIAAGVVAFFLFLIQPDPFSSETILMFVAVAAVCCVAGQYLGSALLPRGNIWAPALRRLDSYLLVAPLWLLLLVLLPDIH